MNRPNGHNRQADRNRSERVDKVIAECGIENLASGKVSVSDLAFDHTDDQRSEAKIKIAKYVALQIRRFNRRTLEGQIRAALKQSDESSEALAQTSSRC